MTQGPVFQPVIPESDGEINCNLQQNSACNPEQQGQRGHLDDSLSFDLCPDYAVQDERQVNSPPVALLNPWVN
jgi:hypothetical protein